jgi:putative IMPACT (imprinted ancient) family translation regulator
MSDDGEPRGTAGRPILDPIIGAGLTDTLVTVVRYYGGIKLGTGGLSAAYGRCSVEALNSMPRIPLILRKTVLVQVSYSAYEPLLRLLEKFSGRVTNEDFGAEVRLSAEIPEEGIEYFRTALGDASRGTARIEIP